MASLSGYDIYMPPVKEIMHDIINSNNNRIFLAGLPKVGKTVILNELKKTNNIFIDVSMDASEVFLIPDIKLSYLYQMCLLIIKISNYLKSVNPFFFLEYCSRLNKIVEVLRRKIEIMYITDNVSNRKNVSNHIECDLLLTELLNILDRLTNIEDITLIIDNFDKEGLSNEDSQRFIYDIVSHYLKCISSISFTNVNINNSEVIPVNYCNDIDVVEEILDRYILNICYLKNLDVFKYRIRFILTREEIAKLIILTDGNFNKMYSCLNNLFSSIEYLNKEEYWQFICNYINEYQRQSTILNETVNYKRKLYLNTH